MKKIILFSVILLIVIFLTSCTKVEKNNNQDNNKNNSDLSCVLEPGKAIYPGTEKCCGDLSPIFGKKLEDGSCWCIEKDSNCGGASICAPCGNGICENQFSEDQCNCSEDCK